MCFPAGADGPQYEDAAGQPECNDLKDNDGNFLVDRDDPKCWKDEINASSYDPNLSEKRELLYPAPVERFTLPSAVLRPTVPPVAIPQLDISPRGPNTLQQ